MKIERVHGDPEDKVVELANISQRSLWISSGFHPNLYNRPRFKEAIIRAIDRVNDVNLLIDFNADWDTIKSNVLWLAEIANIEKVTVKKSQEQTAHWVVSDRRNFRLEKKHCRNEIGDKNLFILDAEKFVADMLVHRFLLWWNNAIAV